jgi:hypothetical protein
MPAAGPRLLGVKPTAIRAAEDRPKKFEVRSADTAYNRLFFPCDRRKQVEAAWMLDS